MDDNRGLGYFFLGLGIGVAVGMIFAPQAGAETRTRIRSRANEGGEYLRRRSQEIKEEASGLIDKGKTAVSRQRENLTSALEAGRQAYRENVSGAPAVGSDAATPSEGI